jgi:hypothetical protein
MLRAWRRAISCCGKVAVARGKCGLGKVANIDWQEISAFEIKNATIRLGEEITPSASCHRCPIGGAATLAQVRKG